jgi:hypothetical protein
VAFQTRHFWEESHVSPPEQLSRVCELSTSHFIQKLGRDRAETISDVTLEAAVKRTMALVATNGQHHYVKLHDQQPDQFTRTIGHDGRCVNGHRTVSLLLETVKSMRTDSSDRDRTAYEVIERGELHVHWPFQKAGTLLVESQLSSSPVLDLRERSTFHIYHKLYRGPHAVLSKFRHAATARYFMMRPLLP